MGSLLSRTVEIQITNKTQNITLMNPRTFFESGTCYKQPQPELLPSSSDTFHFQNSFAFRGTAGILVYEAESFTLAIYFSNPFDYNIYSMELGLELSPGKAHLGNLPSIYTRMASGTYSSYFPDAKFDRVTMGENNGIARLSSGHVRVTAIMSNTATSTLKVVLEEKWD